MSDEYMFDPGQIQEYAESAPEAGFAPVNYGKLLVKAHVLTWSTTDDGKHVPNRRPLMKGEILGAGESLELGFLVEISEFNPVLEFEYERTIPVKKSGRTKTDWTETVEPSLVAVFGNAWAAEVVKSPYVEVEDVPNIAGKASSSGKVWGVPKFLRKFAGKAECIAAREERFGKRNNTVSAAIPPTTVVEQVKALIKSVGVDTAKTMLANNPFGNFDAGQLIQLATA